MIDGLVRFSYNPDEYYAVYSKNYSKTYGEGQSTIRRSLRTLAITATGWKFNKKYKVEEFILPKEFIL